MISALKMVYHDILGITYWYLLFIVIFFYLEALLRRTLLELRIPFQGEIRE